MQPSFIEVTGAKANNLRDICVRLPHHRLTVITGLSGSGKSSLAFDTLYAEGQRRYIETFSSYARGFLGPIARPDVEKITGLQPVIAIEQKTTNRNPRSTVGTTTEIYHFLRLLFARAAKAYSYDTGELMVRYTDEQVTEMIEREYAGRKIIILAPLVKARKGHYRELFESLRRKGYLYARIDGEVRELTMGLKTDRYKQHDIEAVIDRLEAGVADERLRRSVATAMSMGEGQVDIIDYATNTARHFSRRLMCPSTGLSYPDPAPNTFSFNSPQGACPTCGGLGYISDNPENPEDIDSTTVCPDCHGRRLSREALSYKLWDKNIADLSEMDITSLAEWLGQAEQHLDERQQRIGRDILAEIRVRVGFLLDVGLGYLSLGRTSRSLSGGESQRIRLATQIGSGLVEVLYILDEPSIGLHQRDNDLLIQSLCKLRDMGNTVVVVEHDRDMMLAADWLIDIGPGAGSHGGRVLFQGKPQDIAQAAGHSLTADYLAGTREIAIPPKRRKPAKDGWLTLRGATGNNLKGIDVRFPLGVMTIVTGVSGSGKSTLVCDTLLPILQRKLYRTKRQPFPYEGLDGTDKIDKVVAIDQSPIGRTPRSNPATYTGVLDDIRKLFAAMPEAKIRGYKAGRFSFNVKGGRCEACQGAGYKTIEMNFLPDVLVECDQCHGRRYNRETLEVRYKGQSIADVLAMTIDRAVEFFQTVPDILQKVKTLQDVGLGYITLGQSSTTLSGGESQRVKLATELARRDTGRTLYVLDEPTTGLHFEDIRILMNVLHALTDKGNTIIIIEHNTDVVRQGDWIIDMGPEGGSGGGTVVAEGTPEQVRKKGKGYTAKYI